MRPPKPLDPHQRVLVFTWRIPKASAAVVGAVQIDHDTAKHLAALPGVSGAFALATCQRRLFAIVLDAAAAATPTDLPSRLATSLGSQAHALPPPEVFHGWTGIEHLVAVASGLDAVARGESEVGGQFRQAVARADTEGTAGEELSRILQRVVRVARNIRRTSGSQTGSVLPLLHDRVAETAQRAGQTPRGLHVAILGTGRMGRAALRWCRQFEPTRLYSVSRDAERAADAATSIKNARPLTLDEMLRSPPRIDLLIVALPVERPVLTAALCRAWDQPLLICDLSLPRAVDPECGDLPHVTLVHIEDLASARDPPHASHLSVQMEMGDWRRRAAIESHQHRIDRLDKTLRDEITEILSALPTEGTTRRELQRRLARIRHIALEHLGDALGTGLPHEEPVEEETEALV